MLLDPPPIGWFAGACFPDLRALAEEMTGDWIQESRRVAGRSRQARFVVAESCTHNMCSDDPELIVDVILSLIHTWERAE